MRWEKGHDMVIMKSRCRYVWVPPSVLLSIRSTVPATARTSAISPFSSPPLVIPVNPSLAMPALPPAPPLIVVA